MVALAGSRRRLHLAQERVHLVGLVVGKVAHEARKVPRRDRCARFAHHDRARTEALDDEAEAAGGEIGLSFDPPGRSP